MKFFADTADINEIRKVNSLGLIDGVTTNPSLIAKIGTDQIGILTDICAETSGPVSAEVLSTEAEGMISEGKKLAKIADNIVIKLPLIADGLQACKALTAEGIMTNVTLCFSPIQALMTAKAGATFVSPFVGRLDDISLVGMELISQIRTIYDNYGFETEILVASIRTPVHVLDSAMIGADAATIPPAVLLKLINHPLTDKGLEGFLADYKKSLGN